MVVIKPNYSWWTLSNYEAIDNRDCENIDVNGEYQEDNEVTEMMAVLDDKRQDAYVRKYRYMLLM